MVAYAYRSNSTSHQPCSCVAAKPATQVLNAPNSLRLVHRIHAAPTAIAILTLTPPRTRTSVVASQASQVLTAKQTSTSVLRLNARTAAYALTVSTHMNASAPGHTLVATV